MLRWIYLIGIGVLSSCASQGLMKSGAEAEYNRYYIAKLRIGMTQDEVWSMMGDPYKSEARVVRGQAYEIWYYVTKGKILGQSRMISRNFTPVVFQEKILKGWGRRYYNYVMDIDRAKSRHESRKRQQYTDDQHEWPRSEHGYVPSPYEKEQERIKQEQAQPEEQTEPKEEKKKKKDNKYERINKFSIWD